LIAATRRATLAHVNGIVVRDATEADDESGGELRARAFAEVYAVKMPQVKTTAARMADLRDLAGTRRRATVLVAERDGRIVGTVSLFRPGAEGSEAWIPNAGDLRYLATDPDLRGEGISAPILDAAEARIFSWGCDAVCLHIRREAPGLARIYIARGYVRDESGDLHIEVGDVWLVAYVLRRK
jgi:GNAT superfamily N-acetyltransferase